MLYGKNIYRLLQALHALTLQSPKRYTAFGNNVPDNIFTEFDFYEPFWLIDIANICIIAHLLGAYKVTEEQLAALFLSCRQVIDYRVCGDRKSVLRFAFIEFTDEEGARAALGLAGTMLGFYLVRVAPSKTAISPVNPTFFPRENAILSISHDIALGKDTERFYIVAMCLLLLSFIGSFTDFLMFSYTSLIILLALPVLYKNYEDSIDRYLMLVLIMMHLYERIYEECFNKAMEWIVEKMKEC